MKTFLMMPLVFLALGAPKAQDADTSSQKTVPEQNEEFTKLKGTVDGLNEAFTETKNTVDKLAKLKIGGYAQVQWQHADSNNIGSVAGGNFPTTSNQRLQIRRGRLKATYDAGTSQYIAEFEMVPSGVSLKDAEIILVEPWLKSFTLGAGLMDRPFGFEVGYSSSAHETPERSRMAQTLFPGEKDLGIKLEVNPAENMGFLKFFNLKAGLYTGTAGGVTAKNTVAFIPTKVAVRDSTLKLKSNKDSVIVNLPTGKTAPAANGDEVDSTLDFISRFGFKAPFADLGLGIDGGVSIYYGNSLSGNDTVYTGTGAVSRGNKNKMFVREAYGADAQIFYDIPYLGGICLRGEYIQGTMPGTVGNNKPYGTSGAAVAGDFPDSYMANRSFNGFYVTLVQNLGSQFQVVGRYDTFDPNTDVEGSDVGVGTATLGSQDLAYNTLGFGLVYWWDGNFKLTAYYDMVTNEEANFVNPKLAAWNHDLNDNVITIRGQMKF